MSSPVNAAASHLGKRLDELQQIVAALRDAEQKAITARQDANLAEWTAFLAAEGAMELRKITARQAAADLAFAADNAEAEVRHLLRQMKLAQARVDVGRTYSADLRAELATLGRDGAA